MPTPPVFWRSPRLKAAMPCEEIEIPAPPARPSPPGPLLQAILPVALMVVGLTVIFFVSGPHSPLTALVATVGMMAISGVASIITQRLQKRDFAQKTAARDRKYHALLKHFEERLESRCQEQQTMLLRKDVEPGECLNIVRGLERYLWNRSPEDEDYLDLRLGLGDRDSTVKVKAPAADDILDTDPLILAGQDLAARFQRVPDVPVCLPLRQSGGAGVTGARHEVLDTVRSLAMQLATCHSPDELKIVAIFPADEAVDWAWLRWLPHTWADDRSRRLLADEPQGVDELLDWLSNLLNQRKRVLDESHSGETPRFADQLVVFLAAPAMLEHQPITQRLLAEGAGLGAYPIFLADRVKELPKDCRALIKVDEHDHYLTLVDIRRSYEFAPDKASRDVAERFAAAMAPIRLRKPASLSEIPASVSLFEMFQGARTVDDLKISERWRASQKASRSLTVPIGMRSGGDLLELDLHERAHGPNGLVAGMVGAGKSELLQTLVASLAVNFHPHRVSFVLVDYKGGGMADPFVRLPHTLGVITNLQQGSLAVRALTSFNVEAQRRQRLLAEAGVNHIDDYQRLYYKGQVREPMPYLVIIVDEFAEMKTEQPEVAREFVRIARVGRALGFRLILAMQKPAGIVDGQIEANTRFRLCLRVAQTEDSLAMLKRSDAAFLSGVGRAYFQLGANEAYELFQVAYGGAPYDPSGADEDDPLEITEVGLDGSRHRLYSPPRTTQRSEQTQLKALVQHLAEVAEKDGIPPLQGPWLPPLPDALTLDRARPTEGWDGAGWQPTGRWLEPVVGIFDDPQQREQGPLRIPLGKEGHLLVYGAPGYGTSTFVQTLVTSLALTYSPSEVNLYLIDFGGRVLKLFEALPHVGAVVTADETERLERLLRFLRQEIERRKDLLGRAAVATLPEYRQATGDPLPAIVLLLDNYAGFVEANEAAEDNIVLLAREGGNLGIHLVLTAISPSGVRYRVSSNVTMAVAMHLAEQADYGTILGRIEGLAPAATPGRGLIKGMPPREFQAALPAEGDNDAQRSARLKTLASQMAVAWTKPRVPMVRTLPEVVALSDLLQPRNSWPAMSGDGFCVPVGLNVADLQPFEVDLKQGPNFLIAGPVQSGKTTLLQVWLLALAERMSPRLLELYLLDSRRRGLAPLAGLPHVQDHASDEEKIAEVLRKLDRVMAERQQAWQEMMRQGCTQADFVLRYPAIVIAVDDLCDPFDDPTRGQGAKEYLTTLVRQGRLVGIHLIVAGSSNDLSTNSWIEPVKSLKETQTGFMLGLSDDSVFNLRLPYGERDRMLPAGQAYWTQRGLSHKVKLATAQAGSPVLAEWADLLAQRAANSEVVDHVTGDRLRQA
ncbi:MAG TPA: type VII secretion protein EssC [Anaerolineae bacterium]